MDNNLSVESLKSIIEGILFVASDGVKIDKLVAITEVPEAEIENAILELQNDYEKENRGIILLKIEDSFRLCTKNKIAKYIEKFHQIKDKKLSTPLLEVLSIIAFKQPVTKQEIEEIRGVNSDSMVKKLLDRNLIGEIGRKKVMGRPILYGTTADFLHCFGLNNLKDLPELPEIARVDRDILEESNLFHDFHDEIND